MIGPRGSRDHAMRRRHLTLITALGGMGLVVPGARATELTASGALRRANAAFAAALAARDLAALEALWAQDETAMALHPTQRHPAMGWGAVRHAWQQLFAEHA